MLLLFVSLSQAQSITGTPTSSVSLVAPTAGTNCSDLVPGTNISECYFTLTNIPVCARECLLNVTVTIPCVSTDIKCLCAHSDIIHEEALPCLQSSCDSADTQTTVNYYYGLCNSQNYPLSEGSSASTTIGTSSTSSTPYPNFGTNASAPSNVPAQTPALSTAAKAGIGVGATVGGLALVVGLSFIIARRRNKVQRSRLRISQPSRSTTLGSATPTATLSPMSYAAYPEKKAPSPRKAQQMFELPSNRDSNAVHEMDGAPKKSWYKTRQSYF